MKCNTNSSYLFWKAEDKEKITNMLNHMPTNTKRNHNNERIEFSLQTGRARGRILLAPLVILWASLSVFIDIHHPSLYLFHLCLFLCREYEVSREESESIWKKGWAKSDLLWAVSGLESKYMLAVVWANFPSLSL